LAAGSKVIVTGRRAGTLAEAKERFPALVTYVNDVATPSERVKLAAWATETFPKLNILVSMKNVNVPSTSPA